MDTLRDMQVVEAQCCIVHQVVESYLNAHPGLVLLNPYTSNVDTKGTSEVYNDATRAATRFKELQDDRTREHPAYDRNVSLNSDVLAVTVDCAKRVTLLSRMNTWTAMDGGTGDRSNMDKRSM